MVAAAMPVLREDAARREWIVAAVHDAEEAEKRRETRLRRAKSEAEVTVLEKRFRQERRADAQRIADLNEERLEMLRLSLKAPVSSTRARPGGEREMPASTVRELQFYKKLYSKLDPPRRRRPSLAPIAEAPYDRLREKKTLLARLGSILTEEHGLLKHRKYHDTAASSRPSTSSSEASSALFATTPAADLPQRVPRRPHVVPVLRL